MSTSTFNSQIVPADTTQKAGRFEMRGGDMAFSGTGAGFYGADIVGGVSLPNTGTATWHGYLPKDLDITAAVTFNTYVFPLTAAADGEVIALAMAYQKGMVVTTDGTDGTALVAPAVTTGLDVSTGTVTMTTAANWRDKLTALPVVLAANTLVAADLDLPFGFGLTATLTGIAVDEWVIPYVEVLYTRRFV